MLQPVLSVVAGGTQPLPTLTLTDATPAYDAVLAPGGYGGPNADLSVLTRLVVIAPLLPTGRLQAPALLPVADPTGTYASPFPAAGKVLTVAVPADNLYAVRVLWVYQVAVPSGAPTGTLFATLNGEVFATAGSLPAQLLTLDELRDDLDGNGTYLAQAEALQFGLSLRTTEAQLALWLTNLAERRCRLPADLDPFFDAQLLVEGLQQEVKDMRYPQAAALFQQVRRLLGRKPLTREGALVCW